MKVNPGKVVWLLCGGFLFFCVAFSLGFAFARTRPPIYEQLRAAWVSWRVTGGFYRTASWVRVPDGVPRDRITVPDPSALAPGYRVVLGYAHASKGFEAWLFDREGATLHTWPIEYRQLNPAEPLKGDDEPHGMAVLHDGSMVLAFDRGQALARIDPCGDAVWIRPGVYHHLIEFSEEGNLLVWRGQNTPYGDYQFAEMIDPNTGELLRSLSLETILAQSAETDVMKFSMPPGYEFIDFKGTPPNRQDHFHPNDVEMLSSAMSDAFPEFSPGDLLLSFKTRDLVAVVDGQSGRIKWSQNGPWHQQHDPDFQPDGTITVYNNNPHPAMRRSSIIAIDPTTRETRVKFTKAHLSFRTGWGGTHQSLPNGNWQLVIPAEGRVLEVDTDGRILWEFDNVMTDELNAYVINGVWLPETYFETIPSCDNVEE